MDKMRTIALAIGMSIASFNAMAQNNPNKLIDTIKTEVNNLTPEQLAIIQRDTGINFTQQGAESLFRFEPTPKFEDAPKLYLGQFGDKGLAKVTNAGSDGHGGYVYTVEVPNMSYIENGKIFRYVGKHNQNLDNSTINFTHKGNPVPKGNIKIR